MSSLLTLAKWAVVIALALGVVGGVIAGLGSMGQIGQQSISEMERYGSVGSAGDWDAYQGWGVSRPTQWAADMVLKRFGPVFQPFFTALGGIIVVVLSWFGFRLVTRALQ